MGSPKRQSDIPTAEKERAYVSIYPQDYFQHKPIHQSRVPAENPSAEESRYCDKHRHHNEQEPVSENPFIRYPFATQSREQHLQSREQHLNSREQHLQPQLIIDERGEWGSKPRQQMLDNDESKPQRTAFSSILKTGHETLDAVRTAKERFLDWIFPSDEPYCFPSLPPCPPCEVVCGCHRPTQIYAIEDKDCCVGCGSPSMGCGRCFGTLTICPACGRSYRTTNCMNLCLQDIGGPVKNTRQSLPHLMVTSLGPFEEEKEKSQWTCLGANDCCRLAKSCAKELGQTIGSSSTCCRREPPPAPLPARPLQRLAPCFFPEPLPQRRRTFPFNCFSKNQERPYEIRGGLVGAMEDVTAISLGAAATIIETAAELIDGTIDQRKQLTIKRCSCSPPPLRYPKHGFYDEVEDPPTTSTGCSIVDAINNFFDATTSKPSKNDDLFPEPIEAETEVTGYKLVDTLNKCLDDLSPLQNQKPKKDFPHNPLLALVTYLFERPKLIKHEDSILKSLVPCLTVDQHGKNWADRNLPRACFGEGIPDGIDLRNTRIDYVDFNLLPENETPIFK